MARRRPAWCKEAKKALIDRDMTITDLSKEVGVCREYTSNTINGNVYAPELAGRISKFLGIETPYPDSII